MARRPSGKKPAARRLTSAGRSGSRARTSTTRPRKARRRSQKKQAGGFGLVRLAMLGALVIAVIGSGWLWSVARDLPDTSGLAEVERTASIIYQDQEGRLIARRGSSHGQIADLDDLPPYLIDAVLAVEDRRFYSHPGVDVIGTGRAILANIRAGRVVQGGSTLTQQLAKNLFLTPERTMRRKVQEMMLAFWLESQFSKDEILELYLNRVYFGGGAWGVEAAATRYFNKPASQLTLGEAALLAGLLKAPSRYSPVADDRRAAARATVVLDLMTQTGRITENERITAASVPIRVFSGASSPGAQYFIDWLSERVREIAGPDHDDLIVRTTLDINAQRAAEAALVQVLSDEAAASGATQGAIVSLSHDGAVRAMVGGVDYNRSQFNRAVLARRQPGSAFKAFVYASAFEAGLGPDDRREDAPVRVGDWSPQNYNNEYRGWMSLREAFARSSNAVAVRVAEETGRGHVARLAERFGIESQLRIDRSLALGAYEVTPVEMATAYLPFANGGYGGRAFGIERIETRAGEVIYEAQPQMRPVLDLRNYGRMRDLLQTVVREGTGRRAQVPGYLVGGKTGTTNDFRDAWFAGYAGELVTAVWTGNDDNTATDRATGGGPPARIFSAFMRGAPRTGIGAGPVALVNNDRLPSLPVPEPGFTETAARPQSSSESEPVEDDEEAGEEDPIAAFLSGLGGD